MTKDLANLARALRAKDICSEEIEKYDYVLDSIIILDPKERDSNNLNTLIVARNKWVKAKKDVETAIEKLESS
jgi:ribosomal silencing factor RsfS